ncbi:MAG: alpha/beta hydrolase-fold protein [Flavobacteriales bacterium]|nr:alpha/beta hydrolase-fold protein [Flavobacteriales bacterium]
MRITISLLLFLSWNVAIGQRAIVINSLPSNTPQEDQIYFAGEPNDWNPGSADWIFSVEEDVWILEIAPEVANVFEGKITRGSWQTVEGSVSGGFLPNRLFDFSSSDTVFIDVLSWEGEFLPDDLPENLVVFDDEFYMTELNRTRRIRVLLPSNYDETEIDYPVLYMHDGQNLFSDQESFAGEWEIDEAMLMFENDGYDGAIIVALDNGGSLRIEEYTPYSHPVYGGGEGDLYVEFLVNTLKPAIDLEYRTLPQREFTGLMGSSLGGLISFYGGMKYQEVFSKVGVFSPSFWFNDSIYDFADEVGKNEDMQFYFLAGGQESEFLNQEVINMIALLSNEGFEENELNYQFVPNGQHSEWFWAQEFPAAFEWLYFSNPLFTSDIPRSDLKLYPNPVLEELNVPLEGTYQITFYNSLGQVVRNEHKSSSTTNVDELPAGFYLVITYQNGERLRGKFVKQ